MSPVRGPNNESYDEYYSKWSENLEELCRDLVNGLNDDVPEDGLLELVHNVEKHYADYYAAKDGAAKQDVLKVMNPTWKTPLESAFMWIGGWRPTMVFQLVYALSGQQTEEELANFLAGLNTSSMASLSSKQLSEISNLQVRTQKAEDELTHREAVLQQSLADQPLLTLAQLELGGQTAEHNDHDNSMSGAMDEKVKGLEDLVCAADELRFESLTETLEILTTTQAAQFLGAAGQLQAAVRKIGKTKQQDDATPRNGASNRALF